MNELITVSNHKASLPEQEIGLSLASPSNPNKFLVFVLPLVLLFLVKNKDHNGFLKGTDLNKTTYKPLTPVAPASPFDSAMLDKMKLVLDGFKKATTLREIGKTMTKSGSAPGKLNMDVVKELVDVFGSSMGAENKAQIQSFTNMLSMVDKFKDMKKIMDVQKTMKADHDGDMSAQIDRIIEVMRPILPEEQAKNIDNFKKMAQMMKLMSMLDSSAGNESDSEPSYEEEI